jgi:hypothetical protein
MSKTVSDSSTGTKVAVWIAWLVVVSVSGFLVFMWWVFGAAAGGQQKMKFFDVAGIWIPAFVTAMSFVLMVSKKEGYGLTLAAAIFPSVIVSVFVLANFE